MFFNIVYVVFRLLRCKSDTLAVGFATASFLFVLTGVDERAALAMRVI